jgi:hypothetical protein
MVPKWSAICPATGEPHGKAWACGSCLAQCPRASTSSPGDTEVDSVSEPEGVTDVVSDSEPEFIDLVSDSEPEVIDLVSDSEIEVVEVVETPEPDTPEPEVIDLVSESE